MKMKLSEKIHALKLNLANNKKIGNYLLVKLDEFKDDAESLENRVLNEGIRESKTKSCGSCRYAYMVGLKRCNSCTPPTYEKWEQD